jgi:U2 small nuclear ribonucleoprotein B''
MPLLPTRRMSICQHYMTSADANRLYVKNLNDKINKNELKRALYMLFSTYGPVLDIVTTRVGAKKQNMRGQAHVVYRDIQTSTQAMRALQGFELFDKEMVIVYGRGQSSVIPRLRGTFEAPSATVESQATDLQKSIFNAPPQNIPSKPAENGAKSDAAPPPTSQGLKRPREDEDDDEQSDASMEEDEDDAPMEEDDDD